MKLHLHNGMGTEACEREEGRFLVDHAECDYFNSLMEAFMFFRKLDKPCSLFDVTDGMVLIVSKTYTSA